MGCTQGITQVILFCHTTVPSAHSGMRTGHHTLLYSAAPSCATLLGICPLQGYPARPDNIPTRKRPVIYVYELPASVSSPVELDDNLPVGW